MDSEDNNGTGLELLLIILIIVCMRGCHHAGCINEALNPQSQEVHK